MDTYNVPGATGVALSFSDGAVGPSWLLTYTVRGAPDDFRVLDLNWTDRQALVLEVEKRLAETYTVNRAITRAVYVAEWHLSPRD